MGGIPRLPPAPASKAESVAKPWPLAAAVVKACVCSRRSGRRVITFGQHSELKPRFRAPWRAAHSMAGSLGAARSEAGAAGPVRRHSKGRRRVLAVKLGQLIGVGPSGVVTVDCDDRAHCGIVLRTRDGRTSVP